MGRSLGWFVSAVALMGLACTAPPSAPVGTDYTDVRSGTFRWPQVNTYRARVFVFVGHDCPISNGYAPELRRLYAEFASQGIPWVFVYADADISLADARKHAEEYELPSPAVIDPPLSLARQFGVTVKPEVVVVNQAGAVIYRGRIDDRYVAFGKRRAEVTQTELRDALTDVLANRPVRVPHAPALGCDIDFSSVP